MAPPAKQARGKFPEIYFSRGLNTTQRNRLLLKDGEVAGLVNADLDFYGGLTIRKKPASWKTGLGSIHSIYRTQQIHFVGHGTTLSAVTSAGVETVLATGLSGSRLTMRAVGNWLYVSDGTNRKKVYIPTLSVFTWGFASPTAAPAAAVGAAGNPSGTYSCYYSYVAKYADGSEYETDLSPAASAAVSAQKIEWTLPASAPDSQVTHLRLYRDKSGLSQSLDQLRTNIEATQAANTSDNPLYNGLVSVLFREAVKRETQKKIVQDTVQDQNIIIGPYLVAEIALGTTTYSDDFSDADLELKMPFTREMYLPVPSYRKIAYRGKRIYGITSNRLWWGAAFQPDALEPSWDGYNTTTFDEHDNTSLHEYDGFIYVGSRAGFMRLRGATPADWSLDPTPATVGPLSDETCAVTPLGILFPREEGMFLFNGYTSRPTCGQIKDVLDQVNWTAFPDVAFSTWDGRFYILHYPATGSATVNRELILDFAFGEANVRATEGDFTLTAAFFDRYDQKVYYGDGGGVLYDGTGAESRSFEVQTKEIPTKDAIAAGEFTNLHYEADTKGEPLTITAIYDGVEQESFTITTSGRAKGSIGLPQGISYRTGLKISATTTLDMVLYEPWFLE